MARPTKGSPVHCPSCRAGFPLYHPDEEGYISCDTCGRVPYGRKALLAQARASIEQAGITERARRLARAEAEVQANRDRARAASAAGDGEAALAAIGDVDRSMGALAEVRREVESDAQRAKALARRSAERRQRLSSGA